MSLGFRTEEYYKRFIELQEQLRKSEKERLKLEMKFNEMLRVTREEEEIHYRKLRSQYKRFLEEDRRRQDRNERILRTLERIENRLAMLKAKTERFKLLRHQYQMFVDRVYKPDQLNKTEISSVLKETRHTKPAAEEEQGDVVKNYLQNTSSQKLRNLLDNEGGTRLPVSVKVSNSDVKPKHWDLSSFTNEDTRPNYATSIAEDIMNSIQSRYYNKPMDRTRMKEPNNNLHSQNFEQTPRVQLPKQKFGDDKTFKEYPDEFGSNCPENVTAKPTDDSDTDELLESYDKNIFDNELLAQKSEDIARYPKLNDNTYSHFKVSNDNLHRLDDERSKTQLDNIGDKKSKNDLIPQLNRNENFKNDGQKVKDEFNEDKISISSKTKPNQEISNQKEGTNLEDAYLKEEKEIDKLVDPQQLYVEDSREEPVVIQQHNEEHLPGKLEETNKQMNQFEEQLVEKECDVEKQFEPSLQYPVEELTKDLQKLEQPSEEVPSTYSPLVADDQEIKSHIQDNADQQSNQNSSSNDVNYNEKQQREGNDLTQPPIQHYNESQQPDTSEEHIDLENQHQPSDQNIDHNSEPYDQSQYDQPQYDENGQLTQQYTENQQFLQQYDEHGQLIQQQFSDQDQFLQQYDENGQPIQGYDQQYLQQYDENGQPYMQYMQQYDEHGQLIPQYDENGQLIQQYDEHGQLIPQYTDNGQFLQEYGENGQQFQEYVENEQMIRQYEGNEQEMLQPQTNEGEMYEPEAATAEVVKGEGDKILESEVNKSREPETEKNEDQPASVKPKQVSNVMDMLDTDTTESGKQDTKVSNDSDFDISNG